MNLGHWLVNHAEDCVVLEIGSLCYSDHCADYIYIQLNSFTVVIMNLQIWIQHYTQLRIWCWGSLILKVSVIPKESVSTQSMGCPWQMIPSSTNVSRPEQLLQCQLTFGEKRERESAAATSVSIVWKMSRETISDIQNWCIDKSIFLTVFD